MKKPRQIERQRWATTITSLLLVVIGLHCAPILAADEMIDQVLAVVDQNPILQSDLALADLVGVGPSADSPHRQQGHDLLDARIRLELHYLDLVASGALQRLEFDVSQEIQIMTINGGGDSQLRVALLENGLEWEDVEALALRVASVDAWIERHLRPRISVTIQDVEQAYREVIVLPMQERGETPPSLAHVNEEIRRLVSEERLNEEIQRWSDQTRERHQVTRFVQ